MTAFTDGEIKIYGEGKGTNHTLWAGSTSIV